MDQKVDPVYEIHRIKAPYLQLTIILLGVFMAILDTSVVNVAIPKMETELGTTTDQIQWVLTAYMLVIGMLVPITGWLTDKFGPKKLFLFSLATFTIGSILCGAAWNLSSIIFFRIIQAIGGALMQPVGMAMIYRIFPPDRRGTVMGIFGIAMMAAPAFGPALSGYFVEYWSWRLIFYINIPIGIVALILGIVAMHEFPHGTKGSFDTLGFILTIVGFFSLLYGINNVGANGWNSVRVEAFIWVGVACLIVLVMVELKVKNPMIELKVLNNYMFSMSLILSSLISIAMFVGVFLLPLYLQEIRGFSAIRTGLFMTPAALVTAVIMPISGRLFDRIGARPLGIAGLILIILATLGFTTLSENTSSTTIQWYYIIRSAGMGLTMMPLMTAGMNTVPFELTSHGTAMTNTIRQVASSLGIAMLTSYMTTQSKVETAQLSWQVTSTAVPGQFMTQLQQIFQAQGMSLEAANMAATAMINGMIQKTAFITGLNDTFMVSAILTVIAWILVFFYASKEEREIREGKRKKKVKNNPQPVLKD